MWEGGSSTNTLEILAFFDSQVCWTWRALPGCQLVGSTAVHRLWIAVFGYPRVKKDGRGRSSSCMIFRGNHPQNQNVFAVPGIEAIWKLSSTHGNSMKSTHFTHHQVTSVRKTASNMFRQCLGLNGSETVPKRFRRARRISRITFSPEELAVALLGLSWSANFLRRGTRKLRDWRKTVKNPSYPIYWDLSWFYLYDSLYLSLSIYRSIDLSIYVSVYLSIYLSIYLVIYKYNIIHVFIIGHLVHREANGEYPNLSKKTLEPVATPPA